jgi:uroporphyrinogen-III synthase
MTTLQGARVAVLEARMSGELAELVRRHGGEPICAPALREVGLACGPHEAALISGLAAGAFEIAIFQTGVGTAALFAEAERAALLPELLAALRGMAVVCRGPKPAAVLKRSGVPIGHAAAAPYTTATLLEALDGLAVAGRATLLQHYGERNAPLAEELCRRGALLEELCLYEWQLPEDTAPLHSLVGAILAGEIDVVAFTSQVQIRHLLQIAGSRREALTEALSRRTVVAAVGPTCAAALREHGIAADVVPENPKMGPLVLAIGRHLAERKQHEPREAASA